MSAITSVTNNAAGLYDGAAASAPAQTLGQEDFLRLLVAQMSSQDPMNPVSNTDFIAQMAQFTSLEQTRAMSSTMDQLQGSSLIGRQVELLDNNGHTVQGLVSGIQMDQGHPLLVVGGKLYNFASLSAVMLAAPAAAPEPEAATPPEGPPALVPTPVNPNPISSETIKP